MNESLGESTFLFGEILNEKKERLNEGLDALTKGLGVDAIGKCENPTRLKERFGGRDQFFNLDRSWAPAIGACQRRESCATEWEGEKPL